MGRNIANKFLFVFLYKKGTQNCKILLTKTLSILKLGKK